MNRFCIPALLLASLFIWIFSHPARAGELAFQCPDLGNKEKQTIGAMTQGEDGWFFRVAGDLKQHYRLMPEAASYLSRMAEAFRQRGTEVVFISVPPRGIAAQAFLHMDDPDQKRFHVTKATESYSSMLNTMRETGLIVPDLTEESVIPEGEKEIFFFRRDLHWTPFGARRAAQAVAEEIKKLPAYKKLSPATFETKEVGTKEMKETMALELQRLCTSEVPGEPFPLFETRRAAATGEDALFGDAGGGDPAVLVGSSFSALSWFNFDGFLSEYTGLEVANFALSAGLLFNAIVSWTSSPQFQDTHPPFVFWEAPGIYDLNNDTTKYYRQLIPAIYGECKPEDALASGMLEIKGGKGGLLLEVTEDKEVSGNDYYLFLETANRGLASFTLQLDYADGDGEWFIVDRSQHFDNAGRFFIELSGEIEGLLSSVSVDGLPNINATLNARVCRIPKKST